MSGQFTICIGTTGAGIWYSSDSGESWKRSKMELPFYFHAGDIQVKTVLASPHSPRTLFAGTEAGLYRSDDGGASWNRIESPMDGSQIWSIALDPASPDVIFAGTKPPAIYRSSDGARSWEKLAAPIDEQCSIGPPRVTNLVLDPRDHSSLWAGVELGGVLRSRDRGDTWTHLPQLGPRMSSQDVHGLAVTAGRPAKVLVTTPDGIWSSEDEGTSWSLHAFAKFAERDQVSYCRGVTVRADNPEVIFVANGNDVPGDRGAIQRSVDGGKTWQKVPLPIEPNSTIYWIAAHPADPNTIVATSMYGYVYVSRDGGDSWKKSKREFSEIRAVAWVPN